ncbi:glutathione S-transferase theta-1 isoform X2 [Drosophila sechellia]|uniref:GM21142 n=2 Tax=melanogaster subgroup TaxID=32351 RepID=B4HT23_DROSE|nr:glutathione S-transferase theta-1 isoform X2 [Drosophila sechellia]XP_033154969.1 glutathione S-transferase theta-1 [Drosophila mauritiana]EDW47133.1 GM21142 [Drosophila sechellia]
MSKAVKYYYDFLSQPSRALWIAMKLGKTPFEDCPVALRKQEQLTDEYRSINRFQKVPAIVDGKFQLGESVSIVRYLADKGVFSEQLYPKALEDRARVDEFLEWQHFNVRLVCSLFFRQVWLLPAKGLAPAPKPEAVKKLIKDVESNLGLLERLWLEKDFLVGDKLTVADIFGASEINQMKLCQYNVNEKQFPKVAKWMERVRDATNPYYDEAHSFVYKTSQQAVKAKN